MRFNEKRRFDDSPLFGTMESETPETNSHDIFTQRVVMVAVYIMWSILVLTVSYMAVEGYVHG